jgi:hypothetical protein
VARRDEIGGDGMPHLPKPDEPYIHV